MNKIIQAAIFFVTFYVLAARGQTAFGLYSLTMAPTNELTIFAGSPSGTLTFSKQISTGGQGAPANSSGNPAQSQNPLVVYGNYIFAVK